MIWLTLPGHSSSVSEVQAGSLDRSSKNYGGMLIASSLTDQVSAPASAPAPAPAPASAPASAPAHCLPKLPLRKQELDKENLESKHVLLRGRRVRGSPSPQVANQETAPSLP